MVDPTKGTGPVHHITGQKSRGAVQEQRTEKAHKSNEPKDEVVLSKEALNLAQAEKTAVQARGQLEHSDLTLGLDPDFDKDA